MPTLSQFHNAKGKRRSHDNSKHRHDPRKRVSQVLREVLRDSQEVLVDIVLWISVLSMLAPVGMHEIQKVVQAVEIWLM